MSSWILHHDEKYFPNSRTFDPTRWLDPKEARRIDKAFVPFSKGTRACVGIKYVPFPNFVVYDSTLFNSLAYCELYVTLGSVFRRFENLKANDLSEEDRAYNDYFSGQHPLDATKFHVNQVKS